MARPLRPLSPPVWRVLSRARALEIRELISIDSPLRLPNGSVIPLAVTGALYDVAEELPADLVGRVSLDDRLHMLSALAARAFALLDTRSGHAVFLDSADHSRVVHLRTELATRSRDVLGLPVAFCLGPGDGGELVGTLGLSEEFRLTHVTRAPD